MRLNQGLVFTSFLTCHQNVFFAAAMETMSSGFSIPTKEDIYYLPWSQPKKRGAKNLYSVLPGRSQQSARLNPLAVSRGPRPLILFWRERKCHVLHWRGSSLSLSRTLFPYTVRVSIFFAFNSLSVPRSVNMHTSRAARGTWRQRQ